MNVLILGGNRFVGKQLAERLVSEGHKVTCFNRSGTAPEGCSAIQGDRNKGVDVAFMWRSEYTHVVDMCLFNERQFEIMEPFISKDVRYTFVSSGAVYDRHYRGHQAVTEGSLANGHDAFGTYGIEKAKCEEMVKKYMNRWTILRPPYIIGPGCHRPRIGYFIDLLRRGEAVRLEGRGANVVTFISAKDMVKTIMWSMISPNSRSTFNVSNDEPMCLFSFVNQIAHDDPNVDIKTLRITIGKDEATPFPPVDLNLSNQRLRETSWMKFQSVSDIIKDTIEWYDNEGKHKYGHGETLSGETLPS